VFCDQIFSRTKPTEELLYVLVLRKGYSQIALRKARRRKKNCTPVTSVQEGDSEISSDICS
jgi:hypothetical protein